MTFKGGREIFFEKFYVNAIYPGTEPADSTITSFFFHPDGTVDVTIPLVVQLSGMPLTSDLHFGLKVVPEATTATPDEYTLDPYYVFRAGTIQENSANIQDTIYIKMHRSSRLESRPEGIRLVVEIVPNDEVALGQYERIRTKVILTTTPIRPVWWTTTIENNLMGKYTEKKYKLFLNEIDKQAQMSTMLINERPDEAIKLVLRFKAWLNTQDPPIEEVDGSLMQVAI